MLRGAAATAALWLAACGGREPRSSAPAGSGALSGSTDSLRGYVFGTQNRDVTVFEVASRKRLETRPLGATVRWLSNQQTFWDGRLIWTYDFPNNSVEAIAIDPLALRVARRIPTDGVGPAHSLMLTPDRTTAWINIAGDDHLAVIDLGAGKVAGRIATGKFP